MNFPVGIAVGLAMGVTIGIVSGRKSALEAIVAYAQMRGVVLHDASGATLAGKHSWVKLCRSVMGKSGRC